MLTQVKGLNLRFRVSPGLSVLVMKHLDFKHELGLHLGLRGALLPPTATRSKGP